MKDSSVGIDPRISQLIAEKGWYGLSKLQLRSFKSISEGKNVLVIAPTGFGKTEAVMLPILNSMINVKVKPVTVLYITPLKALINDLNKRIEWWGSRLGFVVNRKHGEVPQKEKMKRLKEVPHIMITTPEGLEIDMDWASKFRQNYTNIRWIVIDEVHDIVGTKRGAQLSVLLERLKEFTENDFQRIGLSATIGNPEEVMKLIAGSSQREREIISAASSKEFHVKISKVWRGDDWDQITKKLIEIIEPPSLIFTNSRVATETIHEELEKNGIKGVYVHHSSVSRELKDDVEDALRTGHAKAVVCTKTLELGIHLGDIKKVIMYRPPPTVSSFMQRIGRSGHSSEGTSKGEILCVYDFDVLESLAIKNLAKRGIIEIPRVMRNPLDVAAREIVGMTLQYGSVDKNLVYEILGRSYAFSGNGKRVILSRKRFENLVNYLCSLQLLTCEGNSIKVGPAFFRIWRFEDKRNPWHHDFSEFFSFISSNETFVVRNGDRVIGELDSHYVYRHVRVNDTIRIAGGVWRIARMNTMTMSLEVVPENKKKGNIPIWKGESISKSSLLPKEISRILLNPEDAKDVNKEAKSDLEGFVRFFREHNLKPPSPRRIYVERWNEDLHPEIVYSVLLDEKTTNTLAHMLLYEATRINSVNSYIRTSIYGFSISGLQEDIIKRIAHMEEKELRRLIINSIKRSPLFYATLKEIQTSFGILGNPRPDRDRIVFQESLRQTINKYFSVKRTIKFLKAIETGRIEVIPIDLKTPMGRAVLYNAPIRPWLKDVGRAIVSALKGGAYTPQELSRLLQLPPRMIESKLKNMRKGSWKNRTTCFIDVDTNETRWCLAEELPSIASSEEYISSFTPLDPDETFHVMMRSDESDSFMELIFRPKEILESPEESRRKIPFEEITELRVRMPADSSVSSMSPKFYYINRKNVPFIILNIIASIQNKRYY